MAQIVEWEFGTLKEAATSLKKEAEAKALGPETSSG